MLLLIEGYNILRYVFLREKTSARIAMIPIQLVLAKTKRVLLMIVEITLKKIPKQPNIMIT